MSSGKRVGEPLLRGRSMLRKYFALTKGVLFAKTLGHVKAVDDISFEIAGRQDARPGGRIGLRQDDDLALILNLEEPSGGQMLLHGEPIHGLAGRRAARIPRARCRRSSRIPGRRSTRA